MPVPANVFDRFVVGAPCLRRGQIHFWSPHGCAAWFNQRAQRAKAVTDTRPRPYNGRLRRRPKRNCDLLAGRRAVRIQLGMGHAFQLAANVRHSRGSALIYVAFFELGSVLLEVFSRYARYVTILKWLTISLFAYVGVAFVVKVPWATVGYNLIIPHIALDTAYITAVVAVLGTTISPYLFFGRLKRRWRRSRIASTPSRSNVHPSKLKRSSGASASTPMSAWRSPTRWRCSLSSQLQRF
ncbi:divalent metal cation transporter [Labrys miyagiensis]|uniref:divalent metal cation transporter n=1 Tax=Labrys miyagiensis TaxID=346912 RepID=UPI0032AFB676